MTNKNIYRSPKSPLNRLDNTIKNYKITAEELNILCSFKNHLGEEKIPLHSFSGWNKWNYRLFFTGIIASIICLFCKGYFSNYYEDYFKSVQYFLVVLIFLPFLIVRKRPFKSQLKYFYKDYPFVLKPNKSTVQNVFVDFYKNQLLVQSCPMQKLSNYFVFHTGYLNSQIFSDHQIKIRLVNSNKRETLTQVKFLKTIYLNFFRSPKIMLPGLVAGFALYSFQVDSLDIISMYFYIGMIQLFIFFIWVSSCCTITLQGIRGRGQFQYFDKIIHAIPWSEISVIKKQMVFFENYMVKSYQDNKVFLPISKNKRNTYLIQLLNNMKSINREDRRISLLKIMGEYQNTFRLNPIYDLVTRFDNKFYLNPPSFKDLH